MADFGDYKNNPLWTDITNLDHLSPSPSFGYQWNRESGRWEPDQTNLYLDTSNYYLSGIYAKGQSDKETHRLLSGISGVLSNDIKIGVNLDSDTETHRLLSGISGALGESSDEETHRLLSGISGELSDLHIKGGSVSASITGGDRTVQQPWKKRTKTVNHKIEEDFILLESIPDDIRFGTLSGTCYGTDRSLMDDIYGTQFSNARTNPSMLETGHPDYFIHAEYMDPDRCVEAVDVFHTDTAFGMRQENHAATNINSYELEDYNDLYERGLVDNIAIFNESPYPLQFHTADRRFPESKELITETNDLIYLDSDMGVTINNDEAGRVYVKRPHTISGYTVKYSITYKVTGGASDVIE